MATRSETIARAAATLTNGRFFEDLGARVAVATESPIPEQKPKLGEYLDLLSADFRNRLGCETRIYPNPGTRGGPILVARRTEDPARLTVFIYGHGDVVPGMEGKWSSGRSPWRLSVDGDKIFGRGVADNKGQHTIAMLALEAVLAARGKLGFNVVFLVETSEETGSAGLHEFCTAQKDALRADLFIASDGPRVEPEIPTVFGGARGSFHFDLICDLRKSGLHSGNWGGLVANPGVIIANAISSLISATGEVRARGLVPDAISPAVRDALRSVEVRDPAGGPPLDAWWGEPSLSQAERVYAWNALEVLAFRTGDPDRPVNAIPPKASARLQLRYTLGPEVESFIPTIRTHLQANGLGMVRVEPARDGPPWRATRLDPAHPAARWAMTSLETTLGRRPTFLPSLGGTLPNDCFANILELPTIWVPHSYNGCSQHAPDEHLLAPLVRDGLGMMAGLFWDCGEAKREDLVGAR